MKSEKRLNNTIYLMHIISQAYMEKHKMSIAEFIEFDKKTRLLTFIRECPDIFDGLPQEEMLREAEKYVNKKKI